MPQGVSVSLLRYPTSEEAKDLSDGDSGMPISEESLDM